MAHKYIFANFVSKKGRIGFAYFKVLFKQEFLKAFKPCSWCLLKPIERLLEFVDMVGTGAFDIARSCDEQHRLEAFGLLQALPPVHMFLQSPSPLLE